MITLTHTLQKLYLQVSDIKLYLHSKSSLTCFEHRLDYAVLTMQGCLSYCQITPIIFK